MNNNLLSSLIDKQIIKCSNCGDNHLVELNNKLTCSKCNSSFPKKNAVVDFLPYCLDITDNKEIVISRNNILSVLSKLALPDSAEIYNKVEDIYRRSFKKTSSIFQSAEINCLLERFGIQSEENCNSQIQENSVNIDFNIVYERHYIENTLPKNSTIYRNVRLRNNGAYTWSSKTNKPVFLSYHWINTSGNIVVWEGERTAFPIDISPQRAITLPLKINTPLKSGSYTLQIAMVQKDKGGRWVDSNLLNIPIVIQNINTSSTLSCLKVTSNSKNYEEDHAIAKTLIEDFMRNNYGDENLLLLEVGGGTHPQLGFTKDFYKVVNIDISAPTLELGSLFFAHHAQNQNLCFICCDAVNAPFTESSFDGVVMFSTLHHFAEPEQVLIKLAKLLKKDGFVGIMCEPIDNNLNHDAAVRDLLSGINEQVFSVEEYLSIFKNSGLTPTFMWVDGGSLKAILKKI